MTQRELVELTPDECYALLNSAQVGRFVYLDDLGPLAVPVNYSVAGTDVVFRVEGGAKAGAMQQRVLAFEVDGIDPVDESGWSVLVRGQGHDVPATEVPSLLQRMDGDFPRPWASGIHNIWLRITPSTVTGRRLGPRRSAPGY
jgi:uncharacterized protein